MTRLTFVVVALLVALNYSLLRYAIIVDAFAGLWLYLRWRVSQRKHAFVVEVTRRDADCR